MTTGSRATLYVGIASLALPSADEGADHAPVRTVTDAALLVADGHIVAAGPRVDVEAQAAQPKRVDLGGCAVVPGLVDSHTHLVFAGSRADEMERRSRGETYEQIAQAGGGIVRTVEAVRHTSDEELLRLAEARLAAMLARGVTTLEVKSGYDLTVHDELRMLRVARRLGTKVPLDIRTTLLAHVIPIARRVEREAYVHELCEELIPQAAAEKLADYIDVFVETGAFTADDARTIVHAATSLGLRAKVHVDQLRDSDGAALAAELGALSADHLEFVSATGRAHLARAGVVATVLPGCALFLGKGPWPDGRALRDAGCEVAVATDYNPGSSMVRDLGLCATLAATRCGLTVQEALWGITRGGAKALGLFDRGTLAAGERADFVVIEADDWRALLYEAGHARVQAVYVGGRRVVPTSHATRRSPRSTRH